MNVPIMSELFAQGKKPEYLFFVGSAGSFDDRAKKISRAFVKILNHFNVDFAILGTEESSLGDAAKRAGNEFAFQMAALMNIELFNTYEIKKIITTCPHNYNILKNEYNELGGKYEVIHHTEFIDNLLRDNNIDISLNKFEGKTITYHDSCYLGRANGIYNAPRNILSKLGTKTVEMKSNKTTSLCCGAGGSQIFKEDEKGNSRINTVRTQEAIDAKAKIVATACPFCMTMLRDGVIEADKKEEIEVLDIAEITAQSLGL